MRNRTYFGVNPGRRNFNHREDNDFERRIVGIFSTDAAARGVLLGPITKKIEAEGASFAVDEEPPVGISSYFKGNRRRT